MKDQLATLLLNLVREVAENKLDEYKDSISDSVACGSPAEWPRDREQRMADELADAILSTLQPENQE